MFVDWINEGVISFRINKYQTKKTTLPISKAQGLVKETDCKQIKKKISIFYTGFIPNNNNVLDQLPMIQR